MGWTDIDLWIVIIGALCAMSAALLGNFLVLRRMSMMGDAISHAVLPGLAIAFLVTGSRGSVAMLIGAAIVGVLTALLTHWIHSAGKVDEGASMGVVFTVLFAIGLVLIVRAADAVDLDPGCVLYGAIEYAPLDTAFSIDAPAPVARALGVPLGADIAARVPIYIPRAALINGAVLLLNALIVLLLYKELRISSFDPALATTLGINATFMHYLLMSLVAITTVVAFESVGSILVIAMLIVPAAAAHLLTDRLGAMILISLLLAGASAVLGHVLALHAPGWFGFRGDTSTAGMMAVAAGALFTLAVLFAPRHGVLSRMVYQSALALRIAKEDVLGLLYRLEEAKAAEMLSPTPWFARQAIGGRPLVAALSIRSLRRQRLVSRRGEALILTTAGREAARRLVRSHRLWERYLERHFHIPSDHLHGSAERLEHVTSDQMRQSLRDETGAPSHDPHGKPIP